MIYEVSDTFVHGFEHLLREKNFKPPRRDNAETPTKSLKRRVDETTPIKGDKNKTNIKQGEFFWGGGRS